MQRPSEEDDLGDGAPGGGEGGEGGGGAMPVQAQAIELLCRCDDIPDDGVELRVLKGLLTAATSSSTHLHGQARAAFAPAYDSRPGWCVFDCSLRPPARPRTCTARRGPCVMPLCPHQPDPHLT
jgi:hypothetical protein